MRISQHIKIVDHWVSTQLGQATQAKWQHNLALIVAHSGDSLIWLVGGGCAILWGNTPWQTMGWRVVIANLIAGLVAAIMKRCVRRRRPATYRPQIYQGFDRYAFPSGHATRMACMVMLLHPWLPVWGRIVLIMWAGSVGVAKIALGAHFFTDVLAGWSIGTFLGLLTKRVLIIGP